MVVVHVTIKLCAVAKLMQSQDVQYAQLLMIDSGAGGHVFSNASIFESIRAPTHNACIRFGNEPMIPAAGVGDVIFRVESMQNGKTYTICLSDVYYEPTQPLNMVSMHELWNAGVSAMFYRRYGPPYVVWPTKKNESCIRLCAGETGCHMYLFVPKKFA
jgi:hypothetical protein